MSRFCKVLCEDNRYVCLLVTDRLLGFGRCGDGLHDSEILRCRQTVSRLLRRIAGIAHDDDCPHVPHIVGDGESEDQHHDDRHAEKHQHGTLVTDDMFCLFGDKSYELPHTLWIGFILNLHFLWPAVPGM